MGSIRVLRAVKNTPDARQITNAIKRLRYDIVIASSTYSAAVSGSLCCPVMRDFICSPLSPITCDTPDAGEFLIASETPCERADALSVTAWTPELDPMLDIVFCPVCFICSSQLFAADDRFV
eukprot:CAMPEP_0169433832 /NCGR_PEP_ID=MMETSP1042-20121227/4210_1 /TAXON_ID=464988 /ORGANISM="Hemiselmis andersenii, Strain CCMP1180" /LENGTH=121 /DNA_ID=CAMNT_0009544375 /DNA_START=401 /DNA_END=762 /DNA_ORIENTATION=-